MGSPLPSPPLPPDEPSPETLPSPLPRLPAGLAELLGAGALVASLPPFDLWPLAILAAPLFAMGALVGRRTRWAFLRASLAGLLIMLVGAGWLAETSISSLLFVAVVEAPLFGLLAPLSRALLRRGSLFPTLPLIWIGVEFVRMRWPDTGFAWLQVGHALAAQPLLVQVADLGGVLAVSLVGACAGTALLAWRARRAGALGATIVVVAGIVYGLVRPATLAEPEAGPYLVGIQPGFEQALKEDGRSADERWAVCRELSRRALREHPQADMLIFPETMWPYPPAEDARPQAPEALFGVPNPEPRDGFSALLADLAADDAERLDELRSFSERPLALLIGAEVDAWQPPTPLSPSEPPELARRENAAILLDAEGTELGRYTKHILIPGGEKVPLKGMVPDFVFSWIESLVLSIAGFDPNLAAGPGPELLSWGDLDLGVTICFENVYGDYNRRMVASGARFLVNLSNEGWFVESAEFDHMQRHSVLRAVETRRALFRVTNTGISCLVRPDGRLPDADSKLIEGGRDRALAGVFGARIPLHSGSTLYTYVGDGLGWLALLFLLGRRIRGRLS